MANMTSSGHALSGDSPRDREELHLAVAGRVSSHQGPIRVPRGPYVRLVKPLFDRVVGFCIFVVLLPLTAVVAVAVIAPLTMYFATWGARIAHAIPMRALRACFGLFLAVTAARMFIDLATA